MRLLLDTHIALWSVSGDAKLSKRATQLMTDAEALFVSAASIWEIAIKHALRRSTNRAPIVSGSEAREMFGEAGFEMIDITTSHACALDSLPLLHGDPFDRLLIAQARSESMSLLTHDQILAAYGDAVLLD